MKTELMMLNLRHITQDTADMLRRNDISNKNRTMDDSLWGLVVQTTTKGFFITLDTDIINKETLCSNAINQHLNIPADLQLCLLYAIDHGCNQIYFDDYMTVNNPLLPSYTDQWVKYNGIAIQMKHWPAQLLPDF